MPSFRVQMEILGLLPGHRPEEVLDQAVAAVQESCHVDDRQIDVVAGTPRITVRFTVPDSGPDEEVEQANWVSGQALERVAGVAKVGRSWTLARRSGRWFPVG